ncbi:hypothetical protein [Aureimonas phyllosphaerae]|uniref:Uncharacterized protein n=1 Tax=Aureimonas phyllosphaerae TaxID=1166078 RepID=A0A7W6FW77_9HYPH|nr:hypothetical protein [Aureimonas phyllosphaerae]MBB3937938.1 hypothetical protein [Aureimonas phyllosphaerae]MBB3961889.1 hypothetical protein [Aureimonas phyllosphaerae]SFF54470.1 hypothetical protein SAMN05216566_12517 [Aureimonas phyllosphaerae]
MSPPSRSEAFQVAPSDKFSAALWNAVFLALCGELDDLDALKADITATITAVANGNLDTVLQGQLATRLTSTAAAFDALKASIEQAKEQLALIQAGIVTGSSVQITSGGMFTDTTSAQAAILALSAALADDPDFAEKVARLKDPALTGDARAPTRAEIDDGDGIATTAFVQRAKRQAMAYALFIGD